MVSRIRRSSEEAAPRGVAGSLIDVLNPALWILAPLVIWEIAARGMRLPDYILPLPSQVLADPFGYHQLSS